MGLRGGLVGWVRVLAWGWMAWATVALGQGMGAAARPPASVEEALHGMSDTAGVIFAGQVVAVRRVVSSGGGLGVVEVTFQVDRAVRGCAEEVPYVLREWEGLWASGEVRYRRGQRLLMLLRTPGAAGLSSPVGGMDGAIPIVGVASEIGDAGGVVSGASNAGASTASSDAGGTMVDLRWVGARVWRSTSYTGEGVSAASVAVSAAASSSVAAQGASVETVLGLLNGWAGVLVAR
jgi:hypothetical protein